jgi:hypothetical protein
MGGSAVLQAPHLPVAARCLAGIRFGLPQDGQFRVIAMVKSLIEFPRPQYLAGEVITATAGNCAVVNTQCCPAKFSLALPFPPSYLVLPEIVREEYTLCQPTKTFN